MYTTALRAAMIVVSVSATGCEALPEAPEPGRSDAQVPQPVPQTPVPDAAPPAPTPAPQDPPAPQPPTPTCPPAGLKNLDPGFCTEACPCDEGQGGCATDAHCKGELVCSTHAELGWLRKCVASSGKRDLGAPCTDPTDCLSSNCGCAGASNILQCLAVGATSTCSLATYACDPAATGDHGQPCADAPPGTWRCVRSAGKWPGEDISQVCRDGIWQTFCRSPASCAACCGDFSPACAAP